MMSSEQKNAVAGRDVALVVLRFIFAIILVVMALSCAACAGLPMPTCPEVTVKFCPVQR